MPERSWKSRFKTYFGTISYLQRGLVLHVPVFALLLLRFVVGRTQTPLSTVYVFSLFFGYYYIVSFLLTLPLLLLSFLKKPVTLIFKTVLYLLLLFFVLDGIVYGIYKFHINYFFIELFFIDFQNFGFTWAIKFTIIAILIVLFMVEYGIFYLAKKWAFKPSYFLAGGIILAILSQVIHIIAYERNQLEVTAISPLLPLYFPVTSHDYAVKNKDVFTYFGVKEPDAKNNATLHYPLDIVNMDAGISKDSLPNIVVVLLESTRADAIDERTAPNLTALARKSQVFTNHYSSGNVTTAGLFGLFYGLPSTYWEAVKANSVALDNPVFIDFLKKYNYRFGVISHGNFEHLKIKETVFNGIDINEFGGAERDFEKDIRMNNYFLAFLDQQKDSPVPFYGQVFYGATHHPYFAPEEDEIYSPSATINLGHVTNTTDPVPFWNAYRNSIHFVDRLLGQVIDKLKEIGEMDNTIFLVTSDHGDEFNDNHENYWGHGSNFTIYQTKVPFVLYLPKKPHKVYSKLSNHTDFVPTVLREAFGYREKTSIFSTGIDLLHERDDARPLICSSYVNYAVIIEDNVYAMYPFQLRRYKRNDLKKEAPPPDPKQLREAMEKMNRFFK